MLLKKLFSIIIMAGLLVVPCLVSAMSNDEIAQNASKAVHKRCFDATQGENLPESQVEQLCDKTVQKYLELASPEELAEAAADDFKKDSSAMVFEICYKIVLQDFKK